jgi:uncharacterized protein (TIGR03437 family)
MSCLLYSRIQRARMMDNVMLQKFAYFGIVLGFAGLLSAQAPSVAPGGVLNAASFSKNSSGLGSAVAPGSLVSIFGTYTGATLADASSVPFSTSLGGVSVTFNNIPAPIQVVSPSGPFPFISAQMPYEIPTTTGSVNVVVTVNNVASPPVAIPVVPAAPGVFTYPPDGQSNVILVFVDPADGKVKIAAPPTAAISQVYDTAPIPRGTFGFFYATGLGATTPQVDDGSGGAAGTVYLVNSNPIVMVGGMIVSGSAAAQAPGFPGVNQVNIVIPNNAPAGNNVPLQIQTLDGTITSTSGATIAIR